MYNYVHSYYSHPGDFTLHIQIQQLIFLFWQVVESELKVECALLEIKLQSMKLHHDLKTILVSCHEVPEKVVNQATPLFMHPTK